MTIEFDQLEPAGWGDRAMGAERGRRRRLVAAIAAVMLVAAAAGAGYGIGRNVDGQSTTSPASGASDGERAVADEATSTPTTDAAPRPAATVPNGGDDTELGMELGSSDGDFGGADITASGSTGYAAFGSQPMETLFERVTEGGFALKAQLGQIWEGEFHTDDWGAGDWQPAPWCFESGQLRVSMAGNGIVDVGGVPWFSEPFKGRAVSSMVLGGNDGNPHWVVVVQAPLDVTMVRIVFADGSLDAAAPQNGIAVLTAPGEASEPVTEDGYTYWMDPTPSFDLTFEGDEPVTLTADGVGSWDDPEFRASCTPPPPALPDAGEPPADPAAAEAAIRAAMAALYGEVGTDNVGSDLIDDPTGVTEAREEVQAGGYADDAASATATIQELVFTTPSEAWFRYSIDTPGNDFDNRYGIAVLVDDVWKITRATVCQDLMLAGGDCGGGWEPIYPPGGYDRFGD